MHGLGYHIFPQHRPQPGPAIAPAGKRRRTRTFQLDVPAHPVRSDRLAQQHRTSVAQLRVVLPELMPGIKLCDGLGTFGNTVSRKGFGHVLDVSG